MREPHPPPAPLVVDVLVVVLCLVWSSTWWAIRQGLEELPPCTAAAARFLLAGVVMVFAAAWLRRRESGAAPPAWLWLSAGVANFAVAYGILYWSEQRVPSGIAAVLWAVFPVLMAIAGHTLLNERLRPRQALGFLVAFAGVLAMFFGDLGGGDDVLPSAALLLLSPVAAAVGTVLIKRHGSGCSSLLLNRNGMLAGGALLAGAAWLLERDAPATVGARAVVSTVYLAVVGTCLTFGLYFWLLRWARASRLSLISYVTPPLALGFGWLVGDGTLDAATLAGTGAIALGVAMVVRRDRPRG